MTIKIAPAEIGNPPSQGERILLAHGGGGRLTDELLAKSIRPALSNLALNDQLDCGIVDDEGRQMAMTIDSYVVDPLFFPGGDIGRLAVCGTVNDLAVCGARPAALALSLILTEGLKRKVLNRVMESISITAKEAGVSVVTGDTKVIGRDSSSGGGMYITTCGMGQLRSDRQPLHPRRIKPGDKIILSGSLADHGLAVMLAREMPEMKSSIKSDVNPLNEMIHAVLDQVEGIVFMRDPTRGGIAGLLADLAERCGFHITLEEQAIPVHPETRHAAEMLGLDPLEVANEGKVVIFARPQAVEQTLATLRQHRSGQEACVIGHVVARSDGICEMQTPIGGRRILRKPYGEQLPRIC